jgi:hypothetical protein
MRKIERNRKKYEKNINTLEKYGKINVLQDTTNMT